MDLTTFGLLLLLAAALAADAFAVALCHGTWTRPGIGGAVRIGAAFGVAQGLMPLLGWTAGIAFASAIRAFDHWFVFAILAALGLKAIHAGLSPAEDCPSEPRSMAGWALIGAAVATSIDAAAAGLSLPSLGAPVILACIVIGAVTLAMCAAGVLLGAFTGARMGRRAEVAGGVVLILVGTQILVRHLFFGG